MKKKIQILVLIILLLVIILGLFVIQKQKEQLKYLEFELSEKNRVIENLREEKNNLPPEAEVHPIEKALEDCLKKEAYTTAGMSKCVDDSRNEWNKEIDKYLTLLKDALPEDKYNLLQTSQEKWEEYKEAEWNLLEKTLQEKDGTMYVNIISGDKANIVEKRAKDLSELYFELTN